MMGNNFAMPSVSDVDMFEALMGFVKSELPNVSERICAAIKRDMDDAHFEYCHGTKEMQEQAAKELSGFAWRVLEYFAGDFWVSEIASRVDAYKLHCEVANSMDMEPWEQDVVWSAWERADASDAMQDKINAYMSEY